MVKNKTWPITAGVATLIALTMLLIPHIFPPTHEVPLDLSGRDIGFGGSTAGGSGTIFPKGSGSTPPVSGLSYSSGGYGALASTKPGNRDLHESRYGL